MVPVWEVYVVKQTRDMEDYEAHVRYHRKVEDALQHWKNAGGFQNRYGIRLALAKPEWIKEDEQNAKKNKD